MAHVRGDTGLVVARMAGRSSAMDRAAETIKSRAIANATPNIDTGNYVNSFRVRKSYYAPAGVTDRVVENTDPASWKIEFGFRHHGSGKWIPGQFNLTNAVRR